LPTFLYQDKKVGGVWGKAPMGVKNLRACPAKRIIDFKFKIPFTNNEQRTTSLTVKRETLNACPE